METEVKVFLGVIIVSAILMLAVLILIEEVVRRSNKPRRTPQYPTLPEAHKAVRAARARGQLPTKQE